MAVQAEELSRLRTRMEEMLARHTGRTVEQVRADIERDTVLDAQAAVDYGLADRIVSDHKGTRSDAGTR